MPQRLRKFIGAILLLALVVFWALGAMALAQGRVTELHWALQTLCYVLLGTLWVVPAAVIIAWMERPNKKA